MKIVAISDIHGELPPLPACDVVVICGDIAPVKIQTRGDKSAEWFAREFQSWCLALPCKKVIFIGGNHDFLLEDLLKHHNIEEITQGLFEADVERKIVFLHDSSFDFEGVTFYGTPWCPALKDWAFFADDGERKVLFSQIPNCDILLTHCPPKVGEQGVVLEPTRHYLSNFGDEVLADIVKQKQIKWVLSGHIHSGSHRVEMVGKTSIRNCSIKNEAYRATYSPFEFDV